MLSSRRLTRISADAKPKETERGFFCGSIPNSRDLSYSPRKAFNDPASKTYTSAAGMSPTEMANAGLPAWRKVGASPGCCRRPPASVDRKSQRRTSQVLMAERTLCTRDQFGGSLRVIISECGNLSAYPRTGRARAAISFIDIEHVRVIKIVLWKIRAGKCAAPTANSCRAENAGRAGRRPHRRNDYEGPNAARA